MTELVDDEGPFAAMAFGKLAAGPVADGRGVALGAAADVDADNAAVNAAGPRVIGPSFSTRFPGHRSGSRSGAFEVAQHKMAGRTAEGHSARLGEV